MGKAIPKWFLEGPGAPLGNQVSCQLEESQLELQDAKGSARVAGKGQAGGWDMYGCSAPCTWGGQPTRPNPLPPGERPELEAKACRTVPGSWERAWALLKKASHYLKCGHLKEQGLSLGRSHLTCEDAQGPCMLAPRCQLLGVARSSCIRPCPAPSTSELFTHLPSTSRGGPVTQSSYGQRAPHAPQDPERLSETSACN